jgi:hypothetical protein
MDISQERILNRTYSGKEKSESSGPEYGEWGRDSSRVVQWEIKACKENNSKETRS